VTKLENKIKLWRKEDKCPIKTTTTAPKQCTGKSAQDCIDIRNKSVFDPNRGFLCRVNIINKQCEDRLNPGFQ